MAVRGEEHTSSQLWLIPTWPLNKISTNINGHVRTLAFKGTYNPCKDILIQHYTAIYYIYINWVSPWKPMRQRKSYLQVPGWRLRGVVLAESHAADHLRYSQRDESSRFSLGLLSATPLLVDRIAGAGSPWRSGISAKFIDQCSNRLMFCVI